MKKIISKTVFSGLLFLFICFRYLKNVQVSSFSIEKHISKQIYKKIVTSTENKLAPDLYFDEEAFQLYVKQSVNESAFVVPGTLWCGKKFIAHSYNQLGRLQEIDSCCRKHDLCASYIEPNESKFGLNNTTSWIKLHCECDATFYNCLKAKNNILAASLGYIYFSILNKTCFNKTYPIVDCIEKTRGRCVKYSFNNDFEMKYQWFDNPKF